MDEIGKALAAYARDVAGVTSSPGSTEATYYPAVQRLLTAILRARRLPFEVRVNTSQRRGAGGTDLPDLALYDGAGDFVVVFGEVKLPNVEIADLAASTDRGNQIGRYLSQTGVVLLTDIRSFGLVSIDDSSVAEGPVPPEHRQLLETVDLWPSISSLARGRPPDLEQALALADLLETAVTEFAPIAEPESLARILARQARRAKADLPEKFSDAVQPLLDDFAEALGLTFEGKEGEEFLRSSLIQTAFYGLFASWTLWHHSEERREFRWRDLGEYLKIPFLGALFHEFRNPVRLRELGLAPHLDRASATLLRVDQDRFFGRFAVPAVVSTDGIAESTATHAILYFYEPFLEAFDPDLRKELGVWYTPQEIVRYQVRKIEGLLRDELDCPRGFADDRVVVLDPCCGTGAYLIEVLRCVAEQLQDEGAGAAMPAKLLDAFCRRILGFEILTAPFVVAQLQLYLILSELGLEPDESHRPAIFLTNALTGWDGPEQLKLQFPELQQEHDAAQRVKREAKIIVILGNPPYNRFVGAPMEEEQELADHYKGIRRDTKGRQEDKSELYRRFGIRKQLLDDLYVRFFRLAEIRIGVEAEYGVVSWISNSSYLAGRSHPLMRESLLQNFDRIWIDNLNGDKYRTGKVIPRGLPGEGTADQSVFSTEQDPRGIQVGTAISTFLKAKPGSGVEGTAQVWYRDFWGMSAAKRQALLATLVPGDDRATVEVTPEGPWEYDAVVPTEKGRWKLVPFEARGGYEDWPALDELFPTQFHGVNTNRGIDGGVIETDREVLEDRMRAYFSDLPWENFAVAHPGLATSRSRYDPRKVRSRLCRESNFDRTKVRPYVQFPLDRRWIYYELEAKLLSEPGPDFARNLEDNRFLVTVPQPRRPSEQSPMLLSTLFALHVHDRGAKAFPVRTTPDHGPRDLFSDDSSAAAEPRANLHLPVWDALRHAWGLEGDLCGEPAKQLVLNLFGLALAIAHAPQYQLDHRDALAHDWIHLPLPTDRKTFEEIAGLGEQVGTLLDPMTDSTPVLNDLLGLERRTLAVPSTTKGVLRDEDLRVTIPYFGGARGGWNERSPKETEACHPAWGEVTGDLYLNETAYLANVPERVWRFELGGYPVIKKWLGYRDQKRRPHQPLTQQELDHLRGIVHRLAALLRLHEALDHAYDRAIESSFTTDDLGL